MSLIPFDNFFSAVPFGYHHLRRHPFSELFETMESMKVSRKDGKLSLAFDTAAYKPEELQVHVENGSIVVEGKHSSETEHGIVERQYVQKFRIPTDVNQETIDCSMDNRGNLIVTAQLKKQEAVEGRRHIPIGMAPANKK
ncbi:hypothetical protein L596_026859 [Steinernema carpocapsae]|uniref:SHSP domain-containing protein n=1 Tax=Steinernema carpocapsae TaxID=34508 RepID=A0A4V6XVQ0_STECR|nr:hypothetical protein L596_026859 [Steinernema carpocapsae]